jgi:hypothetical protein
MYGKRQIKLKKCLLYWRYCCEGPPLAFNLFPSAIRFVLLVLVPLSHSDFRIPPHRNWQSARRNGKFTSALLLPLSPTDRVTKSSKILLPIQHTNVE